MARVLSEKDIFKMKGKGQIAKGIKPYLKTASQEQVKRDPQEKLLKEVLQHVKSQVDLSKTIADSNQKSLIGISQGLMQENQKALAALVDKLSSLKQAVPVKPKKWKFKVERNANGFISEIKAEEI